MYLGCKKYMGFNTLGYLSLQREFAVQIPIFSIGLTVFHIRLNVTHQTINDVLIIRYDNNVHVYTIVHFPHDEFE